VGPGLSGPGPAVWVRCAARFVAAWFAQLIMRPGPCALLSGLMASCPCRSMPYQRFAGSTCSITINYLPVTPSLHLSSCIPAPYIDFQIAVARVVRAMCHVAAVGCLAGELRVFLHPRAIWTVSSLRCGGVLSNSEATICKLIPHCQPARVAATARFGCLMLPSERA
jgi:hypothetical protein